MEINILDNAELLGSHAAKLAREFIHATLSQKETANIILATGASQFHMLECLTGYTDIDWQKVRMFHLDEYIGLSESHPASFRKYLRERFIDKAAGLKAAYLIDANASNLQDELKRLNDLIKQYPIDVAMIGIGENGHLAFNDPPADFDTEEPFIVVELDEACRKQQLGEGWFPDLASVPQKAVSMSIRQILSSKSLIVSVPDARKAEAVGKAIQGPLTNICPASILREHTACHLFLDTDSASDLKK